jgi:preprotein translocase subunit SecE
MANDQGMLASERKRKAKRPGGGGGGAPPVPAPKTAQPDAPKKRTTPVQFFREVQAEARKITWTSRQETWITSVMVLLMVVTTALFFVVVDSGIGALMKILLQFAA